MVAGIRGETQLAEDAAEESDSGTPAASIAATTSRQPGEGSRPSGKHISMTPDSTSTRASGQTPAH